MSLSSVLRFVTEHPLTRDRKLAALARFAAWQLRNRLTSEAIIHDWVNGTRFLVRRGEAGLTGNVYAGLHEFADMGFVLHMVRPEDAFVDLGANVGSYTLLACGAIGARGWAFEPVPGTYARLEANVRLNGLDDRVTCVNRAIGASPGSVAFTSGRDTENRVSTADDRSEATIRVDVSTLDAELAGVSPAAMTIDVEGYESAVLDGGSRTLSSSAPMIIQV